MLRTPEKNEHPIVYAAVVTGVVVLALLGAGALIPLNPAMEGRLAGSIVMAGAVLAGWGVQAPTRWTGAGFVARFALCWVIVMALFLLCGPRV